MDKRVDQLREASNPLFGPARLKLGTFCTNLSGGCTMSSIDGLLEADWPSTVTLAQMADEMGFEALVPVGRWKGFGGATDFNSAGFECYTWAAAIGALTRRASVFATSHVPTVHPVMAAKQGTTIDHISKAPERQTLVRKAVISRLTRAQRLASLGSKTIHWVPI